MDVAATAVPAIRQPSHGRDTDTGNMANFGKRCRALAMRCRLPLPRGGLDQRGGVALMLGLAIVPLFVILGLAVDSARGYLVKSKLQQAIDSAGLAGGRAIGVGDPEQAVQMYFDANYPSDFLSGEVDALNVAIDEAGGTLTVDAAVTIPTAFMVVAGIADMTVSARTVIERENTGLELVLVLDDTGSMQDGGKLGALKDAAHELMQILYGDADTVDDLWVAVVPYRGAVNVDDANTAWLDGYDPAAYAPDSWQGCVEAREAPYDQDDTPPDGEPFAPYLWPATGANPWPPVDSANGPNRGCPDAALLPLTAARSTIDARIDALDAAGGGGTQTSVGLVWGWRAVSPEWRGAWDAPAGLPLDYGEPRMKKAVVFLTDGLTNFSSSAYTAHGFLSEGRLGTTSKSAADGILNDRLATICQAMKAQGIELYTIMFQLADPDLETLYRNCASSPSHFFNSPSNDALRSAFRQIGGRLVALRIAE